MTLSHMTLHDHVINSHIITLHVCTTVNVIVLFALRKVALYTQVSNLFSGCAPITLVLVLPPIYATFNKN